MWPARLDWNKNMIFRFLGLAAGTVITTCGWCGPSAAQDNVILKATPKTVAWGYYDAKTPPVLHVKSGDTVDIETLITSSPKRLEAAGWSRNTWSSRSVTSTTR